MRIPLRVTATAIAAVMLLAAASLASARNLQVSNRFFRITWTSLSAVNAAMEVECNVLLEGSFHNANIAKVVGSLIGYITTAVVGECVNGADIYALNGIESLEEVPVPNTLPWHIKYTGFYGRLPLITGVDVAIIGASFLMAEPPFIPGCLYRSTAARPWFGIFELNAEGRVIGYRSDETVSIPFAAGFPCLETIRLVGIGGVQLSGTVSSIFIRLI